MNNGYTKLIDGYWATGQVELDNTWLPIEKNEEGVITAPIGLVEQLANEITEGIRQEKLNEAKGYLDNTDWIIVKINEAQLLGQDIQPLLTKYSVELGEREAKRNIINSLEG